MIDQYPFDGYTDQYPDTRPTPDQFGFGHINLEMLTTPVKHIVYADGNRRTSINIRCDESHGCVEDRLMDLFKGGEDWEAETPDLGINLNLGYFRTPGAGHWNDPMWQLPDTRPHRYPRGER